MTNPTALINTLEDTSESAFVKPTKVGTWVDILHTMTAAEKEWVPGNIVDPEDEGLLTVASSLPTVGSISSMWSLVHRAYVGRA